eukprot:SAG11_NODE_226_length_12046_cov_14.694568_5_plen_84_part_00
METFFRVGLLGGRAQFVACVQPTFARTVLRTRRSQTIACLFLGAGKLPPCKFDGYQKVNSRQASGTTGVVACFLYVAQRAFCS